MYKKGYILLEVIVSLVCLVILILPLLKTVNLIATDRQEYLENKKVIEIIEQVEEDIKFSTDYRTVVGNKEIEGYNISINVSESIDDLYKFNIEISKDGEQKTQFNMMKKY